MDFKKDTEIVDQLDSEADQVKTEEPSDSETVDSDIDFKIPAAFTSTAHSPQSELELQYVYNSIVSDIDNMPDKSEEEDENDSQQFMSVKLEPSEQLEVVLEDPHEQFQPPLLPPPEMAFQYFRLDQPGAAVTKPKAKQKREKMFRCWECGRTYDRSLQLKRHLLTHSGERQYKCNVCDRAFTHISLLNQHFLGHVGQGPFRCRYCQKVFLHARKLSIHEWTHTTGPKPYQCNICEKKFFHPGNLRNHRKTHGSNLPDTLWMGEDNGAVCEETVFPD